jgi:uncharacterized membrane protein
MNVASAALAVLLALFFLALGTAKILAVAPMRALAAKVGFSTGAYRLIGALEVAGAVGLLVGLVRPPLGLLAATGLLLLLAGAVVTHLRNRHGPRELAPAVVTALLTAAYLTTSIAAA